MQQTSNNTRGQNQTNNEEHQYGEVTFNDTHHNLEDFRDLIDANNRLLKKLTIDCQDAARNGEPEMGNK